MGNLNAHFILKSNTDISVLFGYYNSAMKSAYTGDDFQYLFIFDQVESEVRISLQDTLCASPEFLVQENISEYLNGHFLI